ncbi:protein of unknown function [Caballeronia sp. S22]
MHQYGAQGYQATLRDLLIVRKISDLKQIFGPHHSETECTVFKHFTTPARPFSSIIRVFPSAGNP